MPGARRCRAPAASDQVRWWRAFQDPLLDQLVAQALARNQDLAIARQRLLQRAPSVTNRQPPGARTGAGAGRLLRARPRPCAIRRAWAKPGPIDWHWMPAGDRRVRWSPPRWRPPMRRRRPRKRRAGRCASVCWPSWPPATWRCARPRSGSGSRSTRWPRWKPRGGWRDALRARLGSAVEAAQARAAGTGQAACRRASRLGWHAIGVLTGGFPGELKDALAQVRRAARAPPRPACLPNAAQPARHTGLGRRLAAATRGSAWPSRTLSALRHSAGPGQRGRLVSDLFSRASVAWSVGAGASRSLYNGGRAEGGSARQAGARRSAWPMNTGVRRAFQDVEDALAGECRARAPGPSVGRRARQPGRPGPRDAAGRSG